MMTQDLFVSELAGSFEAELSAGLLFVAELCLVCS